MTEALVHPTLTHVGKAIDVPTSTLSYQVQQGLITGLKKKPGPGRNDHKLTAPQVLEAIILNELRKLGANNQVLSARAAAATRAALPTLLASVRGELKESPGYLLFVVGEPEERIYCRTLEELGHHTTQALILGKVPVPIRLSTIFAKLFLTFTLAGGDPAATMPELTSAGASAAGPDTTDARGPGGASVQRFRMPDPRATGLAVGTEGVTVFLQGQGLRVSMSPAVMREMALRLESTADELEGKPRAKVHQLWHLSGETAGNA
jgi:hypothetical protein